MRKTSTSRGLSEWLGAERLLLVVAAVVCAASSVAVAMRPMHHAQQQHVKAPVVRETPQAAQPAPIERQPPAAAASQPRPAGQTGATQHMLEPHVAPNGHLAQWMNQHSNLTLSQQQEALQREPGFRELPQATQQRLQGRLTELNAMTPEKRQQLLRQNEWMEHLSPDQRGQVRGAISQLGALPQDQRRAVAQSFRALRSLPPNERMAALNSERYRGQLNPAQMDSLRSLIRVEPMMPPPENRP